MKFEKYHGLGNDFIIMNYDEVKGKDIALIARKICERKFGLGGDGLILYKKDPNSLIEMVFYNADGTTAPMCGNGIRCFTHYLTRKNYIEGDIVKIKTGAGILSTIIKEKDAKEILVEVNMGKPLFSSKDIPVVSREKEFLQKDIEIEGRNYSVSSVFMGTTHSVVFEEDLDSIDISKIGRRIEKNRELFPVGTNVNFVQLLGENKGRVVTWERGAGLTNACGTGACAVAVIGKRLGYLDSGDKVINLELPGGNLSIELKEDVFMTGPSRLVAVGEVIL